MADPFVRFGVARAVFEHAAFDSVRGALATMGDDAALPDVAAIDAALGARAGVRFVASPRKPLSSREYNGRVARAGEVSTRAGVWHDFANALVWATFPRAKRALHARQSSCLEARNARGEPNRTPEEDALAILDEGGLLRVCEEEGDGGAAVERTLVFGHAILESVALDRPLILGRGARLRLACVEGDAVARLADAALTARLEAGWPAHKAELDTIEAL